MKILHVITSINTGGAETALCRLLETLASHDYQHAVVALGSQGTLSARVTATGTPLTCLNIKPSLPDPSALWRLRLLMRQERPDIIHSWMYHANFAASLAGSGLGLPVLWGIRSSLYTLSEEKLLTRVMIRAGAFGSARTAAVVYNARISAMQHEALGYRRDKTRIIPNGFDTDEFRPDAARRARLRAEWGMQSDSLAIGLVARLHRMKDHDTFLSAARLFVRIHPDVVFVLVGNGLDSTNTPLVERLSDMGLSNHVRLCGRRTDTSAVNAALDIACSSSAYGEAFSNAVAEAMACGVPCVATEVGDAREIVDDTGILIPPRDPHALCAGWTYLASLGEEGRRRLGDRARQRIIERYTLPVVSLQYDQLYRQIRQA